MTWQTGLNVRLTSSRLVVVAPSVAIDVVLVAVNVVVAAPLSLRV